MRLLSFYSDSYTSLEKGFLVQDLHSSSETEHLLKCLLLEHEQYYLCTYDKDSDGCIWQSLNYFRGKGSEIRRTRILPVKGVPLYPYILNSSNSAVFYTFAGACSVLRECKEIIPEVKGILDLAGQCTIKAPKGDFPVIVIEGLDATGKSTLCHALKDRLNAFLLKSPPSCLSQWRKTFDEEPTLIKRAFYALGNYIAACEIATLSCKAPVIIDRFWHSTAAYAIATEVGGKIENLPPHHHTLFQWPSDLLKPDIVLLLTVRPEVRIKRLQERGLGKTKEENELEANSYFRQKVEEAYRRMENPSCIVVDSAPSKEDVLQHILSLIRLYCGL
ncbi:UMP-CMP kinase 2, mitochondrial isoform X2 [Protopterus annectens]|uniref:UMP-CMP kinase 2, mitochondrial isoform X2 n=1 Tax=Protopterus annectens TaxID=7888 RepID=UPI001CFB81EA|nr:UMP-CMP kinase 2, mitochondrial isoform X2 [Protopterus annectens]